MPKRASDIWSVYGDVMIFAVALLAADLLWKLSVQGDEAAGYVCCWGRDVTPLFGAYARHITNVVYALCAAVGQGLTRVGDYALFWETGSGTTIVWSCTPIKQMFIWLCLMFTTRGWLAAKKAQTLGRETAKRLGWIVLGLVLIEGFNVLRISAITLLLHHHPQLFELMHDYVFRYLFYGMMFLLWMFYVEKIRKG